MAILLKEKQQIEKATAKARQLKPRVRVIGYAHFEVTGSKGEKYNVLFSATGEGRSILADCSCKAGKGNKFCCYHIAACYPTLRLQIKEKAAARPTCIEEDCNNPIAHDQTQYCEECTLAIWESELEALQAAAETSKLETKPALPEESALVECRECGEFYPEASMTGAGYAPICSNCLLFGSAA